MKEIVKLLIDSLNGKSHYVEVASFEPSNSDISNPFLNAVCSSFVEGFILIYIIVNFRIAEFFERHF